MADFGNNITIPGSKYFLLKMSSDGNAKWVKLQGSQLSLHGEAILLKDDTSIYTLATAVRGSSFAGIVLDSLPDSASTVLLEFDTAGNEIKMLLLPIDSRVLRFNGDLAYLGGNFETPKSFFGVGVSPTDWADDLVLYGANVSSTFGSGEIFYDNNLNLIHDTIEPPAIQSKVLVDEKHLEITNSKGTYFVAVDTGKHVIKPVLPPYYKSNPDSQIVSLGMFGFSKGAMNFALSPIDSVNDIGITFTNITPFFTDDTHKYRITYRNWGTTTADVKIQLQLDSNLVYQYSSYPDSIASSTVYYRNDNLRPGEIQNIDVYANAIGMMAGKSVGSKVEILTVNRDSNIVDNRDSVSGELTDSILYSVKTVSPNSNILLSNAGGKWLEYTIHFQNTTNNMLRFIRIRDSIDSQLLDISTLTILSSSHNYNYRFIDNHTIEFVFPKSDLSSVNTSVLDSYGYIKYKIQIKPTLNMPSSINNQGSIFFECSNSPIVTSVVTDIINSIKTNNRYTKDILVVPNPTSGKFIIQYDFNESPVVLEVFNLTGQLVASFVSRTHDSSQNVFVDLSNLNSGMYILQTTSNIGSTSSKFIICK